MTTLTLSPKQAQSLVEATARYNIWVGAVRSGKSFASLIRWEGFVQRAPKEGTLMFVGKSRDTLKRNILEPLEDMLGSSRFRYWLGKGEARLYDRTIHIVGANDERAEHKIRGSTLAGVYIDELTIIPECVFSMLQSRLSVPGAMCFATTNPDSPFHWAKKFIDRQDELDIKSWSFNLDDNPSLGQVFKDNLRKEYRGLWYDRYICGQWVLAEGTIFDFFDRSNHVIDYPPGMADYYVVGVDYGTTNPTAFSLIGYSSKTQPNRWLEKEYYWDSKKTLRQKTDTEYAEDLKKFIGSYNVRAIYIDPSAVSFRVELARQGFSGIIEAENEVLDGIRYHSLQLSNGTFKVCHNCSKAIEEYSTYRWDPKASARGEDKPLKENDHLMDSIRYALYSEWFKKEGPRWKPEDVERMRNEAYGITDNDHGRFFSDKLW